MRTALRTLLIPQAKSRIKAGEGTTNGIYKFFTSSPMQSKYFHEATYDRPALIFGTGGNASVHFCTEPFSTSTDCLVMYGSTEANLELIYQYLRTNIHILQAGFKGAGLQHISKDYILDIEIDFPDEGKQASLTDQVRKIDHMLCNYQQQLAKLDELVKSQFVEMFGDPATNEKGWSICDLESVTAVVTYGLTVRPEYVSEGIDLVSARELHKGYVDYNSAPKIAENDFVKLSEKGKPKKNDILFSKTGSIGHCALVTEEKPFAITQNAARIGLKLGTVNPLWLLCYLKMDYIQDWCKDRAKGNAVKDFQLQDMKMIPLFDCPLEIQNNFAAFIKQTDKSKLAVKQSLEKLETLKKSLMHQYFG